MGRRINDLSLLERGMRNMDMKDYRAMRDRASIGERIAFIIFAMAFLVALSHITERDLCVANDGRSNEVQICD